MRISLSANAKQPLQAGDKRREMRKVNFCGTMHSAVSLSIALVTRNRPDSLERTLISLRAQFLEIEERWTSSFGLTGTDVIRFLRDIGYQQFYWLGQQGLQAGTDTLGGNGVLCTWEKISGLA
jgi:hypothetical protein